MSSPAVLSSLLSCLPPRPPTPPREADHDATAPVKPTLGSGDSRLSLHTPPGFQSPASSSATDSASRRIRKKVGFSVQAEYKDPPVYTDGVTQHPTPVSLPRSASKPVKSILKATNQVPNLLEPATANDCDPSDFQLNLGAMLESTVQQLAGGDRESKLDAYLMLTRAWKASNNLPDRVALQEKMGLFTQFMQRDVVARTSEGNLDTSLVNHALNLLNTFLHFPAIASTISNDFGVFIIDHCIRSFEDVSTPKDTARRLMQVISLQNFSPKVMSSDRVARLVSSLHNIEEHLKGKSIVLSRIFVYRKLVQQSRQPMIAHSDWLLDLFTDMLSNLRDIRSAAISLGLEAAFSIGHEKQLSRKVMEILNLAYEDRRYIQYYEERLRAMAKDKHESAVVPEIWSVVILLLRVRLDKWEYAGPWLHIIQNCFNSVDFPTKIAANRAWGRLTYLMHLEEPVSPKDLATLTRPFISQLRRKSSGKPLEEELRQAVLGGICNLFYYAFKPNTNSTLLETYWDTSVKPVLSKLLDRTAESAEDNRHQATAILTGLFDCLTPRRWRVDHIVETALVKPAELPAIDPKWIRRNAGRVFAAIEPILEQDFLAMARTDTTTFALWRTLVSAVASAAAKEIKVSKDTALFVTEALNLLQRIWERGLPNQDGAEPSVLEFLLAVQAYLKAMISSLGLPPFTEKSGKHQAPAKAPLHTLFSMLSTLPPGVPDDKEFAEFFGLVFAPFFTSKGDRARMDLAQDLLSGIPMDIPLPYGTWLLVAENILCWLEPIQNSHHSSGSGGETPVGHDYRDIVKVLERGIRSTPNLPPKHWESLFFAAFKRAREETGDAGVAMVMIEPLAKVLVDQPATGGTNDKQLNRARYVTELIAIATQPRERQAVDAARKHLWGTVFAGSRSSSFDTFDSLYKVVNEVLEDLYTNFGPTNAEQSARLLRELGGFFDRCNRQLFLKAMAALQDGFLPWFQDSQRLLGSQSSAVLASTKSLWDKLSHLISEVEHPERHLQCLGPFFRASFASCHRAIVNASISLWNRLFENVGHIDYPEDLKAALVQLQLHADIILPGLETSSVECAGQQQSFVDSDDDFSLPRYPSTRSSSRRGTPRPDSSRSKSPKPPASLKLAMKPTSASPQRIPVSRNRQNTPRRFRHDDSQLHFAAIEPSSVFGNPVESQVLTERQQEVRERQRQNAALFPAMRSSPGVTPKEADWQMMRLSGSRMRQATTPEPEKAFDDYVSSTPTPRRGQALVMPEHDLTDPPSSPPELRGNPLAAEIRSRSASHSLLEEWQFSSSPVSGSPNANRHAVIPDPSSQRGYVSVVSLPEVVDATDSPENATGVYDGAEPESPADEIVEDSMVLDPLNGVAVPEPSGNSAEEDPSTPRRSARLSQSRAPRETPTPKSDGEVFVDAPSSPLPPTPRRPERASNGAEAPDANRIPVVPTGDTSFDLSDIDDTSFLKLVVELDSGKSDRSDYHRTSPSVSPDGKGRDSPIADCIVVGDSPEKAELPALSRSTRGCSTRSPSILPENVASSQSKSRVGRRKRKRASSKSSENSPKRHRHEHGSVAGSVKASDIEPTPTQNSDVEVHGSGEAPEVILGCAEADSIVHEERIPSSSAEHESSGSASDGDSWQGFTVSDTRDAMEVEADDQDVQCQIALEFSHSQHQEEDSTPASAEDCPKPASAEQPMHASVQQPLTEEEEVQNMIPTTNTTGSVAMVDQAETAAPKPVEKIMNLFRSGLDELRTARLSRQEVYQIEDMFMDMKRELYEAERRGRA